MRAVQSRRALIVGDDDLVARQGATELHSGRHPRDDAARCRPMVRCVDIDADGRATGTGMDDRRP